MEQKRKKVSRETISKSIHQSNLFFTPSIITTTSHEDEFITLENKNLSYTTHYSKKCNT